MNGAADEAGPPAPPGEVAQPFPWPAPDTAGLGGAARALAETWRESTFHPSSFFRALPPDRGIGSALIYYLIVGVAAAAVSLFWRSVVLLVADPEPSPLLDTLGFGTEPASALIEFLLSPVFLLATLFVAAAFVHVPLLLLGGARGGFGTTTRVLCYAYSPQLFAVVPVLGNLIGFVWMIALAVIGLREAHRTDGWKAALAVLLPVAAALLLALVTIMIAAATATGLGGLG